ncbi:MAG: hypothetical protein Q4D90_11730 [bacterium]|nr:hypothetical protein [bacterium]
MKKSIVGITAAIAVTAVVIIAAVPAAAWIREANHENQIQKVEAAVRETSTEPENNHTFRLEEPYFIEYEITDSEGNVSRIAKAEDAQGRIYYKDKEEYLFVPEGGTYLRYEKKDGAFAVREDKKYSADTVRKITKEFDEYARKSLTVWEHGVYAGEESMLDRSCDVYEITHSVLSIFSQKYEYLIDQETGVCLGERNKRKLAGIEETDGESFLCTRMEVGEIDLTIEDGEITAGNSL